MLGINKMQKIKHTIFENKSFLRIFIFLFFISINVIFFSWTKYINFDVTQENRFSVSKNSLKIIHKVPERVNLSLYISHAMIAQMPKMQNFVNYVQDYLKNLQQYSKGHLKFKTIIIEPFSKEEEEVIALGLQPIQVKNQKAGLFFGLIAENMLDAEGVIPYLNPKREAFLEYDIAHLIEGVTQKNRHYVALSSSLPLQTGIGGEHGLINGTSKPYYVYKALQKNYSLIQLSDDYHELLNQDKRPKVALILHPRSLTKSAQRNLKLYLATGGRALITLDPFSIVESLPATSQLQNAEVYSDMSSLLHSLGIEYKSDEIILDKDNAQDIINPTTLRSETHLELLRLGTNHFNLQAPTMVNIKSINFATAGRLKQNLSSKNNFKYLPLIFNNKLASIIKRHDLLQIKNRALLKENYKPTEDYNIAMFVTGQIENTNDIKVLKSQQRPMAAIVISDSDFLDDRLWLKKTSLSGDFMPYADNLNLLLNYIDYLTGKNALITLRGKKVIDRPLKYFSEIKKLGQQKHSDKEKKIKENIKALKTQIYNINQTYSSNSSDVMPSIIQKTLQEFLVALKHLNTSLKRIKQDMHLELQKTEREIKLINVFVVPLFFAIVISLLLFLKKSNFVSRLFYKRQK